MPGPIPKRTDQRRRRNKPEIEVSTASVGDGEIVKPPEPEADWHPVARMFYEALGKSGQSAFYEPSDWAHAFMVAHVMSRCLSAPGRVSSQLFSAVDSSTTRLMVTEGDRRRLRVELERRKAADEDEDEAVASVTALHKKFGG